MLLVFDTSTAACTAALISEAGECINKRDEVIGRGHAERLVPMIAELLDGHAATSILVGVGAGSFTGIRVAVAAAHGLAIGWGANLAGMSSLGLLAASAGKTEPVAAAMLGGHGELFVQQFGADLSPSTELLNLPPELAAQTIDAQLVVGPAAPVLIEKRGWGEAMEILPSAAAALRLPESLRTLAPAPLYARAPDAKVATAA
jgi:tRNA threonylcarbamoyl adenosine modification protein YeaZ